MDDGLVGWPDVSDARLADLVESRDPQIVDAVERLVESVRTSEPDTGAC